MRLGRNDRLSVHDSLRLLSVVRFGRRLRVVATDRFQRRHVFEFRVPTTTTLWHEFVLTGWIRDATEVAYVYDKRSGAFVDVGALFARAQ